MKRIVTLMLMVVMLITMSVNAVAAPLGFVPSIENKGAPSIVVIDKENDKDVIGYIVDPDKNKLSTEHDDCLIITPVGEAETSTEIPEAARKTLLDIYDELKEKGTDAIPGVDGNMVLRDLFDISSDCGDIDTLLPVDGNTLDLKFDLKVTKNTAVQAMLYTNGAWKKLPVVNNGDGTVTATFEDIGAVAFLVDAAFLPPHHLQI